MSQLKELFGHGDTQDSNLMYQEKDTLIQKLTQELNHLSNEYVSDDLKISKYIRKNLRSSVRKRTK